MVLVTVFAVTVFGVPLAIAAARLYRGREVTRLQREATRVAAALPADGLGTGDAIELPAPPSRVLLALYDRRGHLVAGRGPSRGSTEVRSAIAGVIDDDHDGRWLAVAIPLHDEEKVVGAARAAIPWSVVTASTYATWLVMAGIGLAAVALAGAIANWQSSRLVAPVYGVSDLAVRLGDGDFTARLAPSGVAEVDRAADALNRTAGRLGDLVARERAFTADVSHQLNTPLTSLRLGLESALVTPGTDTTAAIEHAVAEVDRLQTTVATLLAIARRADVTGSGRCDVAAVCGEMAERYRGPLAAASRPLRAEFDPNLPEARISADVLREIVAVLLDNATAHGTGAVTVAGRRAGSGVVLDVGDEGAGVPGETSEVFLRHSPRAAGHGIGLALARSLAEANGARLELSRAGPRPVFSVAMAGVRAEAAN